MIALEGSAGAGRLRTFVFEAEISLLLQTNVKDRSTDARDDNKTESRAICYYAVAETIG